MQEDEKRVYLLVSVTSDGEYLKEILEILKKQSVKASFAVTGVWCRAFPEEMREILKKKQDVISHSYGYLPYMDAAGADIQTDALQSLGQLEQDFGVKTSLLLPPYELHDKEAEQALLEVGVKIVVPDIDVESFSGAVDPAREILLKLKNNDILLFKASSAAAPGMMEKLIDELKAMGYSFPPLSELFQE